MPTKSRISFFLLLLGIVGSAISAAQEREVQSALDYLESSLYENLDSSLKICEDALLLADPKTKAYSTLLSRRAVIQDLKGNSELAVKGFLEAIQLQKSLNDSVGLSYSYNNLGISYFYMYRYEEAIRYYRKSAQIDSLQSDISSWAGTMVNIAIIYSNTEKIQEAQEIYDMILKKMTLMGDERLNGVIYSNSAKLYVLDGQYDKALKKTKLARPYIMESSDPATMMTLEVITSNSRLGLEQFQEAVQAARQGLSYDPEKSFIERRMHLYEALSHAFYALGAIDSGNYYNDNYQLVRDSLFTLESQQQLSEIQTKYDLAQKEQELIQSELQKEQYKNQVTVKSRDALESKAERNLFIALAALFVIIGLILFYSIRLRRKEKALLKQELLLQQKLLEQKEDFMREIHHRVKNNLQMVSSMLAIEAITVEDEAQKTILESSKSRIETMSLIHEKLYKNSSTPSLPLDNYIEELIDQIQISYAVNQSIRFESNIQSLNLHIDTTIPLALILNELITNSLKYAFTDTSKGIITIEIQDEHDELVLTYGDGGKGYDLGKESGFGSRLINSLTRQLKGKIDSKSIDEQFYWYFRFGNVKKSEE